MKYTPERQTTAAPAHPDTPGPDATTAVSSGERVWLTRLASRVPLTWQGSPFLALFAVAMFFQAYNRGHLALGPWDESMHVIVAERLAVHPLQPTLLEQAALAGGVPYSASVAHIWLHVPVFGMWASALSMRLLGDTPFAARLPGLLFIALGMIVCYQLGRLLYGRWAGLLAAAFLGLAPYPLLISQGYMFGDITDTPLALFVPLTVLLLVWGYRTGRLRWVALAGVCQGICYLDKAGIGLAPTGILLALYACEWIFPPRNGWKRLGLRGLAVFGIPALLVAGPYNLYLRVAFPVVSAIESKAWSDSFFHGVESWGQPLSEHATMYLFAMYGPALGMLLLGSVAVVGLIALAEYSRADVVAVVWIAALYIPMSLAVTKTPNVTYAAVPAFGLVVARAARFGLSSSRALLTRAATVGALGGTGLVAALSMLHWLNFYTLDYTIVLPDRLTSATSSDRWGPFVWELGLGLVVAGLYLVLVLAVRWWGTRSQARAAFGGGVAADAATATVGGWLAKLRETLLGPRQPWPAERWLLSAAVGLVAVILCVYWIGYDVQAVVTRPQIDVSSDIQMGAYLAQHTPQNATILLVTDNPKWDNVQNQVMFWAHRDVYSTEIVHVPNTNAEVCYLAPFAQRAGSPLYILRAAGYPYPGQLLAQVGDWKLYTPACPAAQSAAIAPAASGSSTSERAVARKPEE